MWLKSFELLFQASHLDWNWYQILMEIFANVGFSFYVGSFEALGFLLFGLEDNFLSKLLFIQIHLAMV